MTKTFQAIMIIAVPRTRFQVFDPEKNLTPQGGDSVSQDHNLSLLRLGKLQALVSAARKPANCFPVRAFTEAATPRFALLRASAFQMFTKWLSLPDASHLPSCEKTPSNSHQITRCCSVRRYARNLCMTSSDPCRFWPRPIASLSDADAVRATWLSFAHAAGDWT